MSDILLLSLIAFVPSVAAVVLLFVPSREQGLIKGLALAGTVVTFVLTLVLLQGYMQLPEGYATPLTERAEQSRPEAGSTADPQPHDLVFRRPWIRIFNVEYYMGVDGINLPLVLLTSLISMLAMLASWNIERHVKGYCALFLLLETGMLGTFLALDFFLFYVFWEVMLLPMYFLIGIWGAPSRVEPDGRVRGGPYAAIKFFLYTLVGGVLMLVALLAFYFYPVPVSAGAGGAGAGAAIPEPGSAGPPQPGQPPARLPAHSFDLMQMHRWAMGSAAVYGRTFQIVMFLLLFVGFAIKLPLFPFHTWLPDAHVEAPTPISMILAGILLKMGGYGFVRIAYPMCPQAAYVLAWPLAVIGVWNIIYGALAAMAQTDFKKLVAYSSISHMGYVMLGMAVWSLPGLQTDIWATGFNGAMFQMIAHGISSAGMFFMVGVIYDRVHHRDLNRFGGLANAMPLYAGLSAVIFFAALGLPGLCGFVGEVMTVLGSWQFSRVLAVVAAAGVILTAGYILWTLQRVFLGTSREGAEAQGHGLPDMSFRELLCAVPLLVLAVVLGVYPQALFSFMEPSVTALVHSLDRTAEQAASLVTMIR